MEALGLEVVACPLIEIEPFDTPVDVDGYAWVIVTSPNGARELVRHARGELPLVAAVGPGTAEMLRSLGVEPAFVPRVSSQDGLLAEFPRPEGKILFAAASPDAPVPLEPHLLALRKVISPWVFHYRPEDEKERRTRVAEQLTVLPQASLREIEKECASGQYTHMHILAHGVPLTRGDDRRYGLALHGASDAGAVDVVEGERLAKALRPPLPSMRGGFVRPSVVTLAAPAAALRLRPATARASSAPAGAPPPARPPPR